MWACTLLTGKALSAHSRHNPQIKALPGIERRIEQSARRIAHSPCLIAR
jgi:hypothetical protein